MEKAIHVRIIYAKKVHAQLTVLIKNVDMTVAITHAVNAPMHTDRLSVQISYVLLYAILDGRTVTVTGQMDVIPT